MQLPTRLLLTSPGVYLQEIPPIPGQELITGIPVFLGVAQTQPLLELEQGRYEPTQATPPLPILLTLWTQFEQFFGKGLPQSYLAHAVRGFFENGGGFCFVIPLKDNTFTALRQGLQMAESLDRVDLICVPDVVRNSFDEAVAMQALVLGHCDRMGDRFAILDAIDVADRKAIAAQKQRLIGDNGALYAPWLKVEGVDELIPPCGHIAGVYARNDDRVGPHRAPANYLIEAVLDISVPFSDQDWRDLNPEQGPGVNCIRSFRSNGIRVWGARTLSENPDWQYVNIRRLKITFLRWAERHLSEVVFEPHSTALWDRLKREVTVYCETLWEQGAIQGSMPEEAFYVKCDEETNPPTIRDGGRVVVEIGLAPTVPTEFIVLSLVHGSNGVTLVQS